jgi:hypothetical protein
VKDAKQVMTYSTLQALRGVTKRVFVLDTFSLSDTKGLLFRLEVDTLVKSQAARRGSPKLTKLGTGKSVLSFESYPFDNEGISDSTYEYAVGGYSLS